MKTDRTVIIADATGWITTYLKAPGNTGTGKASGAFLKSVKSLMNRRSPSMMLFAWDHDQRTFRDYEYADWKGNRDVRSFDTPGVPEESQRAREALQDQLGWNSYYARGADGDDCVATLTRRAADAGNRVIIWGRDKDFRQLLSKASVVQLKSYKFDRKKSFAYQEDWYSAADFESEYGIEPAKWPHISAIAGDSGDNWGGAKGLGPKAAIALLKKYGDLESVCKANESSDTSDILTEKQMAALSQLDWKLGLSIMTLRENADVKLWPGMKRSRQDS